MYSVPSGVAYRNRVIRNIRGVIINTGGVIRNTSWVIRNTMDDGIADRFGELIKGHLVGGFTQTVSI